MKKKNLLYILSVFLLVLASCATTHPKVPADIDSCGAACARLKSLNCSEGQDVLDSDGTKISCEAWCQYSLKNLYIDLKPSCARTITQCDQLESVCFSGRGN